MANTSTIMCIYTEVILQYITCPSTSFSFLIKCNTKTMCLEKHKRTVTIVKFIFDMVMYFGKRILKDLRFFLFDKHAKQILKL